MDQESARHQRTNETWHWREGIPIIRTGDHGTYIGDHRIPLDLSIAEVGWLRSLADGHSSLPDTYPADDMRARMVLGHLHSVGALAWPTECWWLTPPERSRMQRHLMALSEWHADPQTAVAARTTWRIGIHGSGSVADAIDDLLMASGLASAPAREADIVLLVGPHGIDAPEALLPTDDTELGHVPHMPVSAFRSHASIGPLVIPGSTPCLNCLHLHRCDGDPDWPHLVHQWQAAENVMPREVDPLLAWHAATSAVAMLRHWIDAHRTITAHRLRWRFPDPMPHYEPLTQHPACGCNWGTTSP